MIFNDLLASVVDAALWLADKVGELVVVLLLAKPIRRGWPRVRERALGVPRRVSARLRRLPAAGQLLVRLKRRTTGPVLSFPPLWEKALVLAVAVSVGAIGVVMAGLMLFALGPFWAHFGALDGGDQLRLVAATLMLLGAFKLCSDGAGGAWSLTTRTVR